MCGLVDLDHGGAVYSPEKVSTPCIHNLPSNQNKQPFHSARGSKNMPSISCKLLASLPPAELLARKTLASSLHRCTHSVNQMNGNSAVHSLPSQPLIGVTLGLWAFQGNGCVPVRLQFRLPEVVYFSLVCMGSVRLALVNMEKVQS